MACCCYLLVPGKKMLPLPREDGRLPFNVDANAVLASGVTEWLLLLLLLLLLGVVVVMEGGTLGRSALFADFYNNKSNISNNKN